MTKLRRRQLFLAAGASALGYGALRCGRPPEPRLTRHTLSWPVTRRARVAHLTDLHVGMSTPGRTLGAALAAVRASQPDLVVLTGDYLNGSLAHLRELQRFVRQLPGAVVATLGNHDHWSGADAIARGLAGEGVTVLQNESLALDDTGLELVGIDDGETGHDDPARAFRDVRRPHDALVLQHAPKCADAIAPLGGRLILSGHTHGGHVRVPRVTDDICRRLGQPYVAGWYRVGAADLYVNAGLGHSPFRAGHEAHPEVAIFDLVPQSVRKMM